MKDQQHSARPDPMRSHPQARAAAQRIRIEGLSKQRLGSGFDSPETRRLTIRHLSGSLSPTSLVRLPPFPFCTMSPERAKEILKLENFGNEFRNT